MYVAQSKKPSICIYQWGKSQVHMTCHIQEVVTALSIDRYNMYLLGGSKKGIVYLWEIFTGRLLTTWQAHFKDISKLKCSTSSDFFCTASVDGTARAWNLGTIFNTLKLDNKSTVALKPFRSWSPHTLAIKDLLIQATFSTFRVFTGSIDRSVVLYDVFSSSQLMRVSLDESVECLSLNPTQDFLFAGSFSGQIFVVDLSVAAANLCHLTLTVDGKVDSKTSAPALLTRVALVGHTKCVTSLGMSSDNRTLVSSSEDGTVRFWDIWTGQCLRSVKPLNKCGITNALVSAF